MKITNIPICLQGANIYLVFKYTLLEDQTYNNYKLMNSFQREDDANEFISLMNSFNDDENCFYKVIKHKMIKSTNQNINTLLWKQDLGAWILPMYDSKESTSDCDDYLIVYVKDICNYIGLPI
jgi:hypothetical protein